MVVNVGIKSTTTTHFLPYEILIFTYIVDYGSIINRNSSRLNYILKALGRNNSNHRFEEEEKSVLCLTEL